MTWDETNERQLFRLVSYLEQSEQNRQAGFVDDGPIDLRLVVYQDVDVAGDCATTTSAEGTFLVLVGPHEACDAVRCEGIPADDLWETILERLPSLTLMKDNPFTKHFITGLKWSRVQLLIGVIGPSMLAKLGIVPGPVPGVELGAREIVGSHGKTCTSTTASPKDIHQNTKKTMTNNTSPSPQPVSKTFARACPARLSRSLPHSPAAMARLQHPEGAVSKASSVARLREDRQAALDCDICLTPAAVWCGARSAISSSVNLA